MRWSESLKSAGKEFVDVQTGINNSWDKGVKLVKDVTDAVVDYTTETWNAAESQTALNKAAEIAEIRNQGLLESYDRQAEKLRQIRDDDTKTMEERMKANDELGELLEEQEKAMLANAQIRLEQANRKLALDKTNHEATKEQMMAVNELAAIEAQIEGFRSEQISNRISLQREAADIEQELLDEKIDAQSDYWAAITEKMEAAVEAEEKKREEADEAAALSKENYFATVDTGFAAMNQLFAENAAMQKGLAVAETVWNTSKAIMGMLSVQPATPANFALAAATAVMGVAQIANILKTNPDEGGGGGSISVPSVPAINTSVNALETSPNAQIAGLGNAEPQRAFVVSTDITTQQGLDRRILSNATFG